MMLSQAVTNIILAAVICVLVVLTFVILLHCYAKWFLSGNDYSHHPRRHGIPSSPPVTGFLHNPLSMLTIINTTNAHAHDGHSDSPNNKGLSSIPEFVYKADGDQVPGLECVVCLSSLENEEKGRKLQACKHAFHVECIDMWLQSHSTCPICRAPAMPATDTIAVQDCPWERSVSLEIV